MFFEVHSSFESQLAVAQVYCLESWHFEGGKKAFRRSELFGLR